MRTFFSNSSHLNLLAAGSCREREMLAQIWGLDEQKLKFRERCGGLQNTTLIGFFFLQNMFMKLYLDTNIAVIFSNFGTQHASSITRYE